jgi:RNA polymerase sigma-70 factor (ECF subfamily)
VVRDVRLRRRGSEHDGARGARAFPARTTTCLTSERRGAVGAERGEAFREAFAAAARQGDVAALESVLSADAVAHADGDGMRAARPAFVGAERLAGVTAFATRFFPRAEYAMAEAGGRPGPLFAAGRTGGRRTGSPTARGPAFSAA